MTIRGSFALPLPCRIDRRVPRPAARRRAFSGRSPVKEIRPESEEAPRPAKKPRQRRGPVPKGVLLNWCGRWDLNPHTEVPAPKTGASAVPPLPQMFFSLSVCPPLVNGPLDARRGRGITMRAETPRLVRRSGKGTALMTREEVLARVDHTLLKPEARWQDIRTLCDEALKNHTASVCINSCYVRRAAQYLQGRLPCAR